MAAACAALAVGEEDDGRAADMAGTGIGSWAGKGAGAAAVTGAGEEAALASNTGDGFL